MALAPPSIAELELFTGEDYPEDETAHLNAILEGATDALWVFTGMDDYPVDPRAQRITKNAIMDLALWLRTQYANREEINSPFSSERIGSYSYSKMQQAQRGEETGIYWLDMLFRLLRAPGEQAESSWVHSERVFNPEGETYAQQARREKIEFHDPAEPWGFQTR